MVHGCIHFVHNDRMLHAIVFDMNGVIIDSHAAHRRAWRKFLHNQGRQVSEGELDYILMAISAPTSYNTFWGSFLTSSSSAMASKKTNYFGKHRRR
jgi:phosphoglycolate phosphatase-like HAD superfamily hydrolase